MIAILAALSCVLASENDPVPLTAFDGKGILATKRELIEAAMTAGGKQLDAPYEGSIAADPFRGDVSVIITGVPEVIEEET